MFITHIATSKILTGKTSSYEHRAGRRISHQCGAAIIELKKGPTWLLTGDDYRMTAAASIKEAQDDLCQYCSAYFACFPDANMIVVFATGGPWWKWSNIKRSETPRWDFLLSCANESTVKNRRLSEKWKQLFSDSFLFSSLRQRIDLYQSEAHLSLASPHP